ncbi:hypothetical protein POKO110462_12040 [Pontibacter korlensis]|uniref:Uncharacterized protein n=1 Tax=Pontibacter korlensis TaxID=400092 RepID=A0A0E3UYA4_9BACT|nr:hypothetical protein [Pontibacter korlensis]AKD04967.1 hypothetical protein PKOR_20075 [Pontibacter korlensis]
MRNSLKSLLLGITLLSSISSCDKDSELSLPPATQDGRNTLGFKANGKIWVNHGDICNWSVCEDNVVEGRLHKNVDGSYTLVLQAYYNNKSKNISQLFTLTAYQVSKPGTYTLTDAHEDHTSLVIDSLKNNFYHTGAPDSEMTLRVTRLDTVNHVVSGTFEGRLGHYNDAAKTITITDGRFDTKLTYSW